MLRRVCIGLQLLVAHTVAESDDICKGNSYESATHAAALLQRGVVSRESAMVIGDESEDVDPTPTSVLASLPPCGNEKVDSYGGKKVELSGNRFFCLVVPGSAPADEQKPVIVSLHGCGGSEAFVGDLLPEAAEHGFVAVALKSNGRCWGGVDMPYINQAMAQTQDLVPGGISMKHIYAFAFSSGAKILNVWLTGLWTYHEQSFDFAGVAVTGSNGPVDYRTGRGANLSKPTQYLWINGEQDRKAEVGRKSNMKFVADSNGCSGKPKRRTLKGNRTHKGASLITWKKCDAFAEVWVIRDLGHNIPGKVWNKAVVEMVTRLFTVFGAAVRGERQPGVCKDGVCSWYEKMKNGDYWTK